MLKSLYALGFHMLSFWLLTHSRRIISADKVQVTLPYVLILGKPRFSLFPGVCFTLILKQLKQGAKQIYSAIKYRLSNSDRVI